MSRRAHAVGGGALVLALAMIGCAAQHEESMPSDVDHSADAQAEAPAMEAAGSDAAQAAPNFAQMEQQLAANEAKLRALGVPLRSPQGSLAEEDDASDVEGEQAPTGGGYAPPPGTQPKPSPPSDGGDASGRADKDGKRGKNKQSKRERDSRVLEPHRAPEMVPEKKGEPSGQPDPAKAAPLSPNGDTPEQDAAGRCQMICELSQITCELNTQICELADRHGGQEDYRSACERAAEDCEVAQEACDACVG